MESKGIELITKERIRQIRKEGFDSDHDDNHDGHELAYAAVCYAAPRPVFLISKSPYYLRFDDPWPDNWDMDVWDKRKRNRKGELIEGMLLPQKLRIRDLIKAGALIAAEIDRLIRLKDALPENED